MKNIIWGNYCTLLVHGSRRQYLLRTVRLMVRDPVEGSRYCKRLYEELRIDSSYESCFQKAVELDRLCDKK